MRWVQGTIRKGKEEHTKEPERTNVGIRPPKLSMAFMNIRTTYQIGHLKHGEGFLVVVIVRHFYSQSMTMDDEIRKERIRPNERTSERNSCVQIQVTQ